MFKSILAVTEGGNDASTTFGLAKRTAGLFGGAVDAVHVVDRPSGGVLGLLSRADRATPCTGECESVFRNILGDVPGSRYLGGDNAVPVEKFAALGRCADLLVLGRPGENAPAISPNIVSTALHESGRPVLIAPPRMTTGPFRSVVVAWNGTLQAARAIAHAMPFLEKAREVTVLMMGREPKEVGANELMNSFKRNGITAKVDMINPGTVSPRARGRALVAYTQETEADLLVMGAYGDGRLPTFLGVGRATGKVVSSCRVPLLVAH